MTSTAFGRVLNLKAFGLTTALLLPANVQLSVFETSAETPKVQPEVVTVDHEARLNHARELLGDRAAEQTGVDAHGVQEAVESFIQDHVHASLRERDKHHASGIARAIVRESSRHQMDPVFLMSVISHESRFNPRAIGSVGEIGLMQIKPSTAEWICARLKIEWKGPESLLDPETNIRIATAYMAFLRDRFISRPSAYVAAYNMGPGNVRRLLKENVVPAIYAGDVLGKYRGYYRKLSAAAEVPRVISVSMRINHQGQVLGRISN